MDWQVRALRFAGLRQRMRAHHRLWETRRIQRIQLPPVAAAAQACRWRRERQGSENLLSEPSIGIQMLVI